MHVFSGMCFLIRIFCSHRSPPMWRKQNFFMCRCSPVFLFLFLLILFFYLSLKEMWTSVRLMLLMFTSFLTLTVHVFILACIYQSIHHIDPILTLFKSHWIALFRILQWDKNDKSTFNILVQAIQTAFKTMILQRSPWEMYRSRRWRIIYFIWPTDSAKPKEVWPFRE